MTKEKYAKLVVYSNRLKDRLADATTPEKHIGHPETYKQFLTRELASLTLQLEEAKLLFSDKK